MELSIGDIISIVTLLLGGGGVGFWFSLKYARRKEKAEADMAETSAAKEMQDLYQTLVNDVKQDRDEQKAYIVELKDDRRHLREERDALRGRLDKVDADVRGLKREVARFGRRVEMMRPYICADLGCKKRKTEMPMHEEDPPQEEETNNQEG